MKARWLRGSKKDLWWQPTNLARYAHKYDLEEMEMPDLEVIPDLEVTP